MNTEPPSEERGRVGSKEGRKALLFPGTRVESLLPNPGNFSLPRGDFGICVFLQPLVNS